MVPREWRATRGGGEIHESHKLMVRNGIVVCMRCGGVAADRRRKLLVECKPGLTRVAQGNLCRLRDGQLPVGVRCWPEVELGL